MSEFERMYQAPICFSGALSVLYHYCIPLLAFLILYTHSCIERELEGNNLHLRNRIAVPSGIASRDPDLPS